MFAFLHKSIRVSHFFFKKIYFAAGLLILLSIYIYGVLINVLWNLTSVSFFDGAYDQICSLSDSAQGPFGIQIRVFTIHF